tara:strand:+ start:48669 stop:49199 length:531 start_codon:yes stop_codon:yes gene_type:complete
MVLIILRKRHTRRIDLVFIPGHIAKKEFIPKHIDRIDLHPINNNTCLVKQGGDWQERPSHQEAIKVLIGKIKYIPVRIPLTTGEHVYPSSPDLYPDILARSFDGGGEPISEHFNFNLQIRLEKVHGRSKPTIKALDIGHFRIGTRNKIKKTFDSVKGKFDNEFVWIVKHVHPVKAR